MKGFLILAAFANLLTATAGPVTAQTTVTNCRSFANQIDCTQNTLGQLEDQSLVQLGAASLQAMAVQRAAEAQAAWEAAGRQAEQAAIVARERADQTARAIPTLVQLAVSNPLTLTPVNTDLVTDWSLLDGVTSTSEHKLESGLRRRLTVRFALNPTPDGNQFVQMHGESRLLATQGLSKKQVAVETLDGRYDFATGMTLLTSSREPLRADVPALYESVVLIGENGFMAKMGGATQGKVPVGTIPSPVLGYVIAAMPGLLPDNLALWVLDWETGNVIPARLTLQKRETRKLPLARDGASCDEKIPTESRQLAVVVYRQRIGTQEETKAFLERSPHLPISDEVKCIDVLR